MDLATDDLVAHLQSAFDVVKGSGHRLALTDDLQADLELDSLDAIDLMSVLEDTFSSEVIDRVIDSVGGVRTVGDLVDLLRVSAEAEPS